MSPSSLCQGLQSCLDPRQAHPKWVSNSFGKSENNGEGCWKNPIQPCFGPLASKNMELCTETLGCETGTAYTVSDSNTAFSSFAPRSSSETVVEHKRPARHATVKRVSKRRSLPSEFPPPLTTISGEGGTIRMLSFKEDGRLVVKITTTPPSLLQAQRIDGRLCLRFRYNQSINCRGEEQEHGGSDDAEEEIVEERKELEMNGEACNGSVGDEMESGKHRRLGGCKEEGGSTRGKAILKWEPLWVASS